MNIKKAITIGTMAVAMATSAAPTVTDVTAKQRFPWNGLVDITCKVAGIDGAAGGSKFAVEAVMPDSGNVRKVSHFWVVRNGTNSTDYAVLGNGNHHLLWNAQADLGAVIYSNMVVRVTLTAGTHSDTHGKVQLWEDGPYWATTNIGADEPWEYGYYFWWGDTVGYKRENDAWVASDGSSSNFSFSEENTPTYNKDIDTLKDEGWVTSDRVLAPAHDAAHVHLGGGWRMPTKQELTDLTNKCDWTWTTMNGVNGYFVRGRGDYSSSSIFLPCAGYGNWTWGAYTGSSVAYWSSVPNASPFRWGSDVYYRDAWGLFEDVDCTFGLHSQGRRLGLSVRPVQGFSYTIRFNTNGGSGIMADLPMTDGMQKNLTTNAFTRPGYQFIGWATSPTGVVAYIDAQTVYKIPSTENAIVDLYAVWIIAKGAHEKVQLWEGGPCWATSNIGADEPWECGYYFWWGDTVGYKRENDTWVASDGSSNYSGVAGTSGLSYSEYDNLYLKIDGWITTDNILAPEHDAAHMHWGGDWRMPTKQELKDLNSKCDWTWTTMNGVNGYFVRGRGNYASNGIFLPRVGERGNGGYWSSEPSLNGRAYGYYSWHLYFDSSDHNTCNDYYYRDVALPVRPVQGGSE